MPTYPGFYQLPAEFSADAPRLQQGDIVARVPFTAFEIENAQVPSQNGVAVLNLRDEAASGVRGAVVALQMRPGIVISQTCDLERGNRPINVCPLRPFSDLYAGTKI